MHYTVMPLSYLIGANLSLIVTLVLILHLLFLVIACDWSYGKTCRTIYLLFVAFVTSLFCYNTYKEYSEHFSLTNTEVVAKMITSDVSFTTQSTGVQGRGPRTLVHILYVFYETPTGIVAFPRGSGIVYPESAILYQNPK